MLLAVLVLAAGMPLSAAAIRVFTDVKEDAWYNKYVLEAYEAGLISGFDDATFRPDDPISKVHVIVCLAKLAGYSESPELDTYIQRHKAKIAANGLSESTYGWAYGYIAYALEKGIVTEEELATFIKSDGSPSNAKRYEVAVYFARALGFEAKAKSYINLVLGFVDNEMISQWSRGYIKVLLDRGIMKGDTENRFKPNDEIRRSEIATMLSSSLKYAGTVQSGTTSIEGIVQEVGSAPAARISRLPWPTAASIYYIPLPTSP